MTRLEIIDRLCQVSESLLQIIRKQGEIIERDRIENAAVAGIEPMMKEAEDELDAIEYALRKYCDTDDIEKEAGEG